ncbi:MAG TPA: DNA helicase RecQ, partial [Clostridiaceae bacterium]|nr:DNA helicase RecQ [Clostridiaceae bacterium]
QEDIINSILSGKDTFAVMPTGAGKSICYQIPALLFSGITIVISPLISLMKDQVDGLINLGIKAAYINSSLGYDEIDDIFYKAKNGEIKLLYVAPERLESTDFKELLKTIDISMVAIDEAHCVSQWGHDFRPSYRYIAPTINELPKRPVISAFTATATENVKEDVVSLLGLNKANVYVMGFDRKNLSFTVIRGENKKDFILDYVKRNSNKSGIIYAATRKEVDSLYEMLNKRGYLVGKYHAGLS